MAGVEATVTYAAQGSSDFSTTVPTNAGNYTVKVQYEAAIMIHTGTANFTIAPKTLTKDDLIYSGPITKVYDTNTNAPQRPHRFCEARFSGGQRYPSLSAAR